MKLKENKDKQLVFRIPPKTYKDFQKRVKRNKARRSEVLRDLLNAYLYSEQSGQR